MMMTALLCMMAQSVRADKWDGVTYEEPEFSMNWYITCDIETLEGTMHASIGDYIITGVNGEQYPCKPDIFEKTYEPV